MRRRILSAVLLLSAAGCKVGPNYQRPVTALPDQFRGVPTPAAPTEPSLADTKWENLFDDQTLNGIVNNALAHNFDLRIAYARVEQARAQLGITRANQLPFFDLSGGLTTGQSSSIGSVSFIPAGTNLSTTYSQVGLGLSWELDIWGRLRRLTEAARAQYLASDEGRRFVTVTLVSDTITAYLQLLEQDSELRIGQQTRELAQNSLRLVELRRTGGAATGLDVSQAEQLLYTATAQIAAAQRTIAQTEDTLSLLQGSAPSDQPRGRKLEDVPAPAQAPAGLPSQLLARRPDIRQAEQNLIAANAQIGAARALYFPQISLTALAGGQSRALSQLLSGPAQLLSFAPGLALPVFHGGQVRNQVRLTEAQERELLATYQRTIYTALRETSDALISLDRTREQRTQQEQLVRALNNSVRLSELRYRGGLDSYLQVLDAQRNQFTGELALAQLRLQERLAVVQLYRALGGGWQS